MNIDTKARAVGCMIGAAYGDALGAPVEFMSYEEIVAKHGAEGIDVPDVRWEGLPPGIITDDTQMAMATANGILDSPGQGDVLENIFKRYLEWREYIRHNRRGAGKTCRESLDSGVMGTIEKPLNEGKGCGGVMRAHPVGIAFRESPERAFEIGMRSGAITHGTPEAYVPSGVIASIVSHIFFGATLEGAAKMALVQAENLGEEKSRETVNFLKMALDAATDQAVQTIHDKLSVPNATMKGGGWLGYDALAIGLYAARVSLDDPVKAVKIAVNHSGDSDSTGDITGAMMGAIFGPEPFLKELDKTGIALEHREELISMGERLAIWQP
ncbi:MAG: ADP-ribosylglycohydrolase family protein [bacterium]|nr:ADP-ribosylglycohydrolase family protein [bacterium]